MKLCTIIGVGPGISMSVARRFGKQGFALALVARNESRLQGYVDELTQDDIPANGFAADAGHTDALKWALDTIHEDMQPTDVLVYNVADTRSGRATDIDPDQMMEQFQTNVTGALVASQICARHMKQQGGGKILFTGGGLALNPSNDYTALSASKAALRNLASSLHDQLKDDGIHVAIVTVAGAVEPGGPFDPDRIADTYWQLYSQNDPARWDREIIYTAAL